MFKKIIFFTILSLVFFVGCQEDMTNSPTQITLQEAWFPWAGYAGEVVAQFDVDSTYNVTFTIQEGSENIAPIRMVLTGESDFGIASAENLILSNQKGADLVAIGVVNYKSATCFITLENSGIEKLKDFEGHTIGVLTGSETETIYRLLVEKNNLDKSKLTEIAAPYDLSTFINTDTYDVRPAFIYDEPISLDRQNIDYNIIKPENYGVEMIGAVYFTRKEVIENNPQKVQNFVNVVAKGWEKAIEEPKYAINLLKKYDKDIDVERELASLRRGIEYFEGEGDSVLYANRNSWQSLGRDLEFLGKVDSTYDVSDSFNNSFIKKYHSGSSEN